jgi:hypothetical protein
VRWLGCRDTPWDKDKPFQVIRTERDHADAALDIIEELEGREVDFVSLLPKWALEEIQGLRDRIQELEEKTG